MYLTVTTTKSPFLFHFKAYFFVSLFLTFLYSFILELYFTQSENLYFSMEYFNLLIIVITDKLGFGLLLFFNLIGFLYLFPF